MIYLLSAISILEMAESFFSLDRASCDGKKEVEI